MHGFTGSVSISSILLALFTVKLEPMGGPNIFNSEGHVPSFFRLGGNIFNRRGEQSLADYASNHANQEKNDRREE
jgi:hypothetical protein